jgi:hypothetical protein
MDRVIDLMNAKGRNAEVAFHNPAPKRATAYVIPGSLEKPTSRRIVRSLASLGRLEAEHPALADALIAGDPEIDLEAIGRIIRRPTRIYADESLKVLFKVRLEEQVYDASGALKETREPRYNENNVAGEFPVKAGKLFPKKEIYNRFIFARKYQISHVNGLTYDFLFEIAKELHEADSLMMVGAGAKGQAPLVFQDGGKPFRAFLEGRVKPDGAYLLVLHLTNLELKALPQGAPAEGASGEGASS